MEEVLRRVIAGGAAAYLSYASNTAINDRKMQSWKYSALQTNHLLLLTWKALNLTDNQIQFFPKIELTFLAVTPIVIIASAALHKRKISEVEAKVCSFISKIYHAAIACISLVFIGKRHYSSGVAMLATFIIRYFLPDKYTENIHRLNTVFAALAFIGYGAWVIKSRSALAKISLIIGSVASLSPPPSSKHPLLEKRSARKDSSSTMYYDTTGGADFSFTGGGGFSFAPLSDAPSFI